MSLSAGASNSKMSADAQDDSQGIFGQGQDDTQDIFEEPCHDETPDIFEEPCPAHTQDFSDTQDSQDIFGQGEDDANDIFGSSGADAGSDDCEPEPDSEADAPLGHVHAEDAGMDGGSTCNPNR